MHCLLSAHTRRPEQRGFKPADLHQKAITQPVGICAMK